MKNKKMIFNAPQAEDDDKSVITLDPQVMDALKGVQNRINDNVDSKVKDVSDQVTSVSDKVEDIEQRVAMIQITHNEDKDPMGGYDSHSEFLVDVMAAATQGRPSERLQKFAAIGDDEAGTFSNPDGGFLLPEGMIADILSTDPFAIQGDTGLSTRRVPMEAQIVHVNARVDKNHSDSVTGGFRVYRRSEAATVNPSNAQYEQIKLSAEALMGLSYATDELLQRSPVSFAALISSGFETEYRSKLNNERLRGTGAGEYMGVFNSPALLSIAKESGQAADSIVGKNVIKMRQQAWRYNECVWMANLDTYEQLTEVHITGTNDDRFLFAPGNGVDVPDTLLGRPVVFDENMSTIGDKGDLLLVNWNEYLEGMLGGVEFASSIHVRFVNNETAFKFNAYCDGQPWWRTALTPKNSAQQLSPFVTLDERA